MPVLLETFDHILEPEGQLRNLPLSADDAFAVRQIRQERRSYLQTVSKQRKAALEERLDAATEKDRGERQELGDRLVELGAPLRPTRDVASVGELEDAWRWVSDELARRRRDAEILDKKPTDQATEPAANPGRVPIPGTGKEPADPFLDASRDIRHRLDQTRQRSTAMTELSAAIDQPADLYAIDLQLVARHTLRPGMVWVPGNEPDLPDLHDDMLAVIKAITGIDLTAFQPEPLGTSQQPA